MKQTQIWIAAMACVSVLAGAQVAVAGEQPMIPAQWREHRFPVTTNAKATEHVQNPANDQDMIPAQWREDRLQSASNATGMQGGLDQAMVPAQWREDRFDNASSMADASDHGTQDQGMTNGSC